MSVTVLHTEEEIDFYLMADLSTRLTGLPFVVWISQRGNARHDIRVKVSAGLKAIPEEMVSVGIRPDVHLVAGELASNDLKLLKAWLELNCKVIVKFWNGELATDEALVEIKAL